MSLQHDCNIVIPAGTLGQSSKCTYKTTTNTSHAFTIIPHHNITSEEMRKIKKQKITSQPFGGHFLPKEDDKICIVSQNLHYIGVSHTNNHKEERAKT